MNSNPNYSTCIKHIKGESVFSSLNIKILLCCTKGIPGACNACFITLHAMDVDVRNMCMIMCVTE